MGWMNGRSESWQAGNFFLHHHVQTGSGAHPASYPIATGGGGVPSLGVKWLGCEANHSPSSTPKVKNVWSYTSAPQYAFMALCSVKKMHKDTFTFTLFSNNFSLYCSPCKRAGKIILLYVLTLMFFDRRQESKDFQLNSSEHSLNSICSFLHECNFNLLLSFPNISTLPHFQRLY
jgi:hypothetical protein